MKNGMGTAIIRRKGKLTKLEIKKLRKKLSSMRKLKEYLESTKELVKMAKDQEKVKKELLCDEFGIESSRCSSTSSEEIIGISI